MGFLGNGTILIWWIMGTYPRRLRHALLPAQWVCDSMLVILINRIVEVVYSAIGALIFSLYIIFDTYNICNVLHPDEYIVGAVNLYDIFGLYLLILVTLTSSIFS